MNKTIQFDMADAVAKYSATVQGKYCVATELPADASPTMAYIPFQMDKTSYSPDKALEEGTLFPALNKPFYGRSVL